MLQKSFTEVFTVIQQAHTESHGLIVKLWISDLTYKEEH